METREVGDTGVIRRRRACLSCEKRFTTYERIEGLDIYVIKKDGSREKFDREKIKRGIMKACEKRPISIEQIEQVVEEIESEIRRKDSVEVTSKEIGNLVMKKLRKLDHVAYIRFASVYKEFKDIESFEKELRRLKRRPLKILRR
jgi:transcriptional repressor NrdR